MTSIKRLTIEKISNRHGGEYDFILSGQPLLQRLSSIGRRGLIANLDSERNIINAQMREFLTCQNPGDTANGHVPLYICQCRDYDCGFVSAKITHSRGCFIWSDFAYIWTDFSSDPDTQLVEPITKLKSFRFKEADYIPTIDAASNQLRY